MELQIRNLLEQEAGDRAGHVPEAGAGAPEGLADGPHGLIVIIIHYYHYYVSLFLYYY